MNILNSIKKIIKNDYPQIKQSINLETVLGDIDFLDSLELATIAVELENEYQIRFNDEDLENFKSKTVKEIIKEIEILIKEK